MSGNISKYDLSTHSDYFIYACTHTEYILNIAASVRVKLLDGMFVFVCVV
jgi:hypothetical protein